MKRNTIIIVILFALAGNAIAQAPGWQWAERAGGASNDVAKSIAVDASGNSYIAGYFNNPTITFGSTTLTNVGGWDIYLAKYDANGNVKWAKSAGGSDPDVANSIAIDASGNVYIAGQFESDTLSFGSIILRNTNQYAGTFDMFLAKYDAAGNLLWADCAGGTNETGHVSASSVTVDASGNIFVAGQFDCDKITFGSTTLTGDLFVTKYDAGGNVLWAKSAGNTSQMDNVNSVAVDASGNAFVAGVFYNKTITFNTVTLTNSYTTMASPDIFLVKYDASGIVQWAKSAVGTNDDRANSVAVDSSGNIFLAGWFASPTLSFGSITLTNSNTAATADIYLAKYDENGNVIWAKSAGGTKGDGATSVAADASGNTYITGTFASPALNFGSTALTKTGLFLAKYDSSGNALWAKSADGTGGGIPYSVGVDASGNSYIAGYFSTSALTFGSTILTNAGVYNYDIFLAKSDKSAGIVGEIAELRDFSNISVYPNPATYCISIETPQKTTIEILNIQGQIILRKQLHQGKTDIDIGGFGKGIYILRLNSKDKIQVKRIVKE
jgi:hypothetical protein